MSGDEAEENETTTKRRTPEYLLADKRAYAAILVVFYLVDRIGQTVPSKLNCIRRLILRNIFIIAAKFFYTIVYSRFMHIV